MADYIPLARQDVGDNACQSAEKSLTRRRSIFQFQSSVSVLYIIWNTIAVFLLPISLYYLFYDDRPINPAGLVPRCKCRLPLGSLQLLLTRL